MKGLTKENVRTLAFYQLQLFIEKGQYVAECKEEWFRRTQKEYALMPY